MGLNPLRLIALGFGSGLSPVAPGTAGTLFGWATWLAVSALFSPTRLGWALVIAAGLGLGWWACTHTARALAVCDPGAIVWDEVIAFWIILWFIMPIGLAGQAAAFGLFRLFDAVKRGPVGWADACFKAKPGAAPGWAQGFGIIFDDLVAAACALVVFVAGQWGWMSWQATH
jgi:phosphatidylglycerophosphatase A